MKPDRTNYSIWLIDFLDGNLSDEQVSLILAFLDENQDLRDEFEELSRFRITPEQYSFPDRGKLKKAYSDLSQDQFDLLCIAAIENDLPESERKDLEGFLSENPGKKKSFELLESIKLKAPIIYYPGKNSLKKLSAFHKAGRYVLIGLSAAAAVLLLVSVFIYPFGKKQRSGLPLASIQLTDTISINYAAPLISKRTKPLISSFQQAVHEKVLSEKYQEQPAVSNTIAISSQIVDSSLLKRDILAADFKKMDYVQRASLSGDFAAGTLISINLRDVPDADPLYHPGFNDFIARVFREKILRSKTPENGSLKMYEVADASINGINRLLGWQMSLQKNRNKKGELKSLYFSSKIIKFNAPVKKAQL
jgi:hypothetical protein